MNVETGHVVADINDVPDSERAKYVLLPGWLRLIAKEKLNGQKETRVDLDADTPLAHYARARVLAAEEKRISRRLRRVSERDRGGFR